MVSCCILGCPSRTERKTPNITFFTLSLLLNAEKSTKAGDDKETQCKKCQELIERLFGPANIESNISSIPGTEYQINYNDQNEVYEKHPHKLTPTAISDDKNDSKLIGAETLQSTTGMQEEETLAQKIEIINETTLVEAQTESVDGFNLPPRVLDQLAVNIFDDINKYNEMSRNTIDTFASNANQENNSKGSSEPDNQNTFDTITNVDTPSSEINNRIVKEDMEKLDVSHTSGSENPTIEVQLEVIKKKRPFKETEIDLETSTFEPLTDSMDESVQLDSVTNNISKYQYDLDKDFLIDMKKEETITEGPLLPDQKTPILAIETNIDMKSVEEALYIVQKDINSEQWRKKSSEKVVLQMYIPNQSTVYLKPEYILPDLPNSSADQGDTLNKQLRTPIPSSLMLPTSNNTSIEPVQPKMPQLYSSGADEHCTESIASSPADHPFFYYNQGHQFNEQASSNYSAMSNIEENQIENYQCALPEAIPADQNTETTLANTVVEIDVEQDSGDVSQSNYIQENIDPMVMHRHYDLAPLSIEKDSTTGISEKEVDRISASQLQNPPEIYRIETNVLSDSEIEKNYTLEKSTNIQAETAMIESNTNFAQTPATKPKTLQRTNLLGPTTNTFSLQNIQNQLVTDPDVEDLYKSTVTGPGDESCKDIEYISNSSKLPELNPRDIELPLSEMLRRVRLRSHIETCRLGTFRLFAEKVNPQKELLDSEDSEQIEPEARKCGTKKPVWPPPSPNCPPRKKPLIPIRAPPCPKPCQPHCPVSYEPPTPTCPPPIPPCPSGKDPCAKFTKLNAESGFYTDDIIKTTQNYCDSDQEYHKIEPNFVECELKLEEVTLTKTFDPWVPIPSWPPWPPKRPERRPMVCPQEGCKERPCPRVEPCAERGGPPCESFPKRRSFSLSDILILSIDDQFFFPEF